MRRFILIAVIAVVAIFTAEIVLTSEAAALGKRVIVVFDPASSPAERRAVVVSNNCSIIRELSIVPAIVIHLPEQASDKAREAILQHAPVITIEEDLIVKATKKPADKPGKPGGGDPPPQPEEVLPWGVDEIDADLAWPNSTGVGVKVAAVDTGVDTDHPDLADNIAGGANIINPRKHYKDDNGHGTHVAGIIAAVNNEIGVIGVASEASLYGVKVLDRKGLGWLSDVIAGLEWCINNGINVVNMSLGLAADSPTFHAAIIAVNNAGIVQVAAAGNVGAPVDYPAAYPETIGVAATDSSGNVVPWSNYGPEIDVAAPGAEIFSTYKGSTYDTLDGTSMATPHVAGTAALILENQPSYTPADILGVITSTADDLGFPAVRQGAGLVDAEEAVLVTE